MNHFFYLTEQEIADLTVDADTVIDFMGDRFLVDCLELGGTLVTQYQVCDGQIVHQEKFLDPAAATAFVKDQINSYLDDKLAA